MRLVKCKLGYEKVFTPEEQTLLARSFVLNPPSFKEDGTFESWYTEHLIDLDEFPLHLDTGISEIKVFRNQKIEELQARQATIINQKVNVAVPRNWPSMHYMSSGVNGCLY